MKTKANDEWLVCVETTDGSRQFIQDLTVDKVICDFPLIDVERAIAEVKREKTKFCNSARFQRWLVVFPMSL
jgi:hypothetical protein